tara:strand:+ start:579 stop:776 length:198 start_codon:yes stop_codon:yes gene_type:complete
MPVSEWIKHVLAHKKAKGISFKQALKEAGKTYKSSTHSTEKTKKKRKVHKKRRHKKTAHKRKSRR